MPDRLTPHPHIGVPVVTELRLPLEPVSHDPFIDGLPRGVASEPAAAPAGATTTAC
jgi:hypothetical protein